MALDENDHGKIPRKNSMEDVDWVMQINGCFIAIWTTTHGLHLEVGKFGCPSTRLRVPKQQYHNSMNVRILNNPHARQK